MLSPLNISSRITLQDGNSMPLFGLGVWAAQSGKETYDAVLSALNVGYRHIDTAEMYAIPPSKERFGTTETIIGNWFASRANRDKVILASKISGPGLPWLRGGNNIINKKNILAALEGSLSRLQTDYIDLYQLHWPNRGSYHFGKTWDFAPEFDVSAEEDNFLEVLHTLQNLIQDGKILAAISEERIRNLKHYNGTPTKSILEVLNIAKVDPSQVTTVAIAGLKSQIHKTSQFSHLLTSQLGHALVMEYCSI